MDYISVIGISTLLSERSARRTCPDLRNFRYGRLPAHARIFKKVSPNEESLDSTPRLNIASCALIEHHENDLLISIFDIPQNEWNNFLVREFDYDLRETRFLEQDGDKEGRGIACYASTDIKLMHDVKDCPVRSRIMKEHRKNYKGAIWRNNIFPSPQYLKRGLSCAAEAGPEFVENYLDHSYLADNITTLRCYLESQRKGLNITPGGTI